ncbi:hypothetical protein KIH27_02100 [Mycobacterium sp. M1]|uniref:Uncharacterized protein n=1 Tax=Mycolicibacter acidiphilus TaxID=2835306 RepID=A0ABS5REI5_9MYCO|nr:hypothetical protein [Mycolicibacter acidiphilus]MBS9532377.1 hypothetical protein [Mycolicibacter acidiphilus]
MTAIRTPSKWAFPKGIDLHDSDIRPEVIEAVRANWPVLKAQFGMQVREVEVPRVSHDLRVAGTPDRIVVGTHPLIRKPTILDFKFSGNWHRPETQRSWAAQMAVYQRCLRYSVELEKTIADATPLQMTHAIIVLGDPESGDLRPYILDTTTAGVAIDALILRRQWTRTKGLLTPLEIDSEMTVEEALYDELLEAGYTHVIDVLSRAQHLDVASDRLIELATKITRYGPVQPGIVVSAARAGSMSELISVWERLIAYTPDPPAEHRIIFRQRKAALIAARGAA